ncbi:MAG: hypothetical protein OSB25_06325 [Salibacteraceae bacterium]|nr:hypothetical protein [Salibacteraceae bacterium]
MKQLIKYNTIQLFGKPLSTQIKLLIIYNLTIYSKKAAPKAAFLVAGTGLETASVSGE